MARDRCPREDETIRAAWTDGQPLPPSLSTHVAECRTCSEIAALASALRHEREEACGQAHPPAAGLVWWRAERRAREEAARRAAAPISFVHAIALGCAAAALAAVLGLGVGSVRESVTRLWSDVPWPATPAGTLLGALSALPLGVLLLMAATLLLAPVAVYLALPEK